MKKTILITLATLAVLTAVLAALIAYRLNDLVIAIQPQLERRISEVIGAPVSFGKISLSVFPTLKLAISEAKITTSKSSEPALLTIGSLKAALKLKPLLSKTLEITAIEIETPKIATIRDGRGFGIYGLNNSSTAAASSISSPPGPVSSSAISKSERSDPINISISRILLSNGDISFRDFITLAGYSFQGINLDATTSYQRNTIHIPAFKLSLSVANDRPVQNTPIPIRLSGSDLLFAQDTGKLVFPSFTAASDLGSIIFKGALETKTLQGSLSINSKAIDIQNALYALEKIAQFTPPINPTGTISTDLAVDLKGPGTTYLRGPITLNNVNVPLQMNQSIQGLNGAVAINGTNTELEIKSNISEFMIRGINIPNLIISKISDIPTLEGTLRSHIAPEHQKYFDTPNTQIKSIKSECVLKQKLIDLRSLTIISEAFTIEASGLIPFDSDMQLSTTLTLNSEVSTALAKRSKTVAAFLDSRKMLTIPVIISGRAPGIIATPDLSKLLQGAGGKLIEEHAGALLKNALGGNTAKKLTKAPIGKILGF